MVKSNLLLCLLLLAFFNQVQTVNAGAVSKTYTWNPPSGNQETFSIYLETEQSWRMDVSLEVFVKFTLATKHFSLNRVDVKWTRIEITDRQTFLVDSGKIEETASLRNIGDYYERRISLQPPSIDLARGQNISSAVIWNIQIDMVDNSERHQVYTGSNSLDPLMINVFRPFLSTVEAILLGVASVGTVVGIITGTLLYKKKQKSASKLQGEVYKKHFQENSGH